MSLLDPKSLAKDYQTSKTYMRPYWDSFDEFERISRNKPHPKVISAKLPTVTDGTLAGVINSQPKRIIQQIPTGQVVSTDMPEIAEVANYIWQNEIIHNVEYNGTMIQKSWIMAKKALTYGVSVSYAFFKGSGDYFGADFSIPYIRDIILERGKIYGPDCDVLFMRQWYTPDQIQLIIDKESRLKKRSKDRGDEEPYDPSWNIKNLTKLKGLAKQKDADALTADERAKSPTAPLIEIVHAFQTGVGEMFYSFAPALPDKDNIVRERENKDPRGRMPLTFLYAEADLSNPLGVGYAEMSGGMQNLLDSEVQSYQLAQKLMLNPPVMKWGSGIKGSTLKYKSNAVWDMGSDPNSKVEAVNINNEAISNFVNNYGLIKSQILNLTNNQDSSIPGTTNASTNQSKTSQGVNQQQQRIGFDDNYFRKQFEQWFENNAETMLNIHFAESQGNREVQLTDDFLEDIAPNMKDSSLVTINKKKKTAAISYSDITAKFKFRVDPTSSESPDDADQVANLQSLLSDVAQNPFIYYWMMNDGRQLHLGEAYYDLFSRLGVANIQKIVTKLPKDPKTGQPVPPPTALSPMFDKPMLRVQVDKLPAAAATKVLASTGTGITPQDMGLQVDPATGQAVPAPTPEGVPTIDPNGPQPQAPQPAPQQAQAPESDQTQPQEDALGPGDKALASEMLKAGFSSDQVLEAIKLMHQGRTHDEILQTIGEPQGQALGV